jgi:1,2-phenylacetyl-CoA epoxidase catalytic subunit
MRREETYHLMHLDTWLRRLAGGSAHERLASALERAWADAQALFSPLSDEAQLVAAGILPDSLSELRRRWLDRVTPVLATLELLAAETPEPVADGRLVRTDDFRWLHGEFTLVAGSEEGAAW